MADNPSAELLEAGKRMADHVNGLLTFHKPWEIRDKWIAVTLENGSCDSTIYDTMRDAKLHSDPDRCMYFTFKSSLGGIHAREAALVLMFHRSARASGMRQRDPDDSSQPFLSNRAHSVYAKTLPTIHN